MDNTLIKTYTHLTDFPRPGLALTTLRRIASLVKPLMLNHNFRVGVLCEFYPQEANLLGLNYNQGERICIRLRAPYDTNTFLPEENLVGTMLHELTHNLYTAHDDKFWGFLQKLTEEYRAIRARGWNGEGFYSEGRRLGGRELPVRVGRRNVEKRATLANGSGQKLGGAIAPRNRAVLRGLVAAAAEKRVREAKGCAGDNRKLAAESAKSGIATKAEEEDPDELAVLKAQMELIEEDERNGGWTEDPQGVVWIRDDETPESSGWSCPVCTLINPSSFLVCDACTTERPSPQQKQKQKQKLQQQQQQQKPFLSNSSQRILQAPEIKRPPKLWRCHNCRQQNEEMWWTCTNCATMKLSS
ncbi:zinc ion binding protein [Sphaerosporella brunnea]|uniref:Zinc ion binding protein n=1 Tax=Sphaerosporella brunnea TaxID=1250544 RepID=A0A5J5EEZ5_9PEZI|nr:zinc ion binding protein [Sphaerosporella brunnea]